VDFSSNDDTGILFPDVPVQVIDGISLSNDENHTRGAWEGDIPLGKTNYPVEELGRTAISCREILQWYGNHFAELLQDRGSLDL
jgi:hypothetical protein